MTESKKIVVSEKTAKDLKNSYDIFFLKDKNIVTLIDKINNLYSYFLKLEESFDKNDRKELSAEIKKSEEAFVKATEAIKKFLSFVEDSFKRQLLLYDNENYEEKAKYIDKNIICDFDYDIGFTEEGWFYLKLPFILPKRFTSNSRQSNDRFRRQLEIIFDDFFGNGLFGYYEQEVVLVYKFSYSKKLSSRRYIDFDNLNSKALTDTAALYLLVDDSPKYMASFNISEVVDSNTSCTELFIAPREEFLSLLKKIGDGSAGNNISDTYPGFCESVK